MLPIKTDQEWRIHTTSWAMWIVCGICTGVFLTQSQYTAAENEAFVLQWGFTPSVFTYGVTHFHVPAIALSLFRMITCQFIHAGGLHVGFNLIFLYVLGRNIENELNAHIPFAIFYLSCGVAACLLHWVFAPMSTVPAIGASGAVAGVMGAYLITHPGSKVKLCIVPPLPVMIWVSAWVFLGLWFAGELFSGWQTLQGVSGGNVAHWAHVGGFIWGCISGRFYGLRNQSRESRENREHWQGEQLTSSNLESFKPHDKLQPHQYEFYDEHLSSSNWQQIKREVKERDRYQCQVCGSTENIEVHHLTYERLGNENLEDLVTLCRDDHRAVHRISK